MNKFELRFMKYKTSICIEENKKKYKYVPKYFFIRIKHKT